VTVEEGASIWYGVVLRGDIAPIVVHRNAKVQDNVVGHEPSLRADRIGVTGFCMGGRISFLTACLSPAVKAAAPFYGGGIGAAALDNTDKLQAPMLLFFGEVDPFIPIDEVERTKARLAQLKKTAETVLYPGAPHGFFCNDRDSYRPDAAKDAWRRPLAFFAQHLKA
jgi:carboxymethylenebutenolidase